MVTEFSYYNPNKLLSYNRILNFVIGARGYGKTYGYKKYVINRFLKTGKQFIYSKRYKTDMKNMDKFFNAMKNEFPEHEFQVKGYEFKIDGKVCGWAVPLSMWQSLKSTDYPDVETIIYDEFLLEKDNRTYIPNEPNALLNLMDTVFRTRNDVRCICLSNATTIVNPFFLYFDLIPDVGKRYNAYKSVVVEICDSMDFSEERKKTRFGELINGTDYAEMAIENTFVNDSDTFIEKRTKDSKFICSIVFKGLTMGIWVDTAEGLMYLSSDHDPSSKFKYSLSTDDFNENTLLMNNWKDNYHLYKIGRAFKNGYLRFENQVIRTTGYQMFKKMRIQ